MTTYDWRWYRGEQLDTHTLYALLALRTTVFVVEQQCAYQELDGHDLSAATDHLAVWADGTLAASLRLRTPVSIREPVTIGRVVIAQDHRGAGLGHRLMAAALEHLTERWPGRDAYLSAQAHLQNYYAGHGFVAVTDTYLEDNIPHIGMYRHGG